MPDELPDVPALRMLEPPPGGLTRLRARLADEARRPRWLAAIPLAALAVIALVLLLRRGAEHEVVLAEPAPLALADPTIGGGDVAFYWVASSPGTRRPAPAEPPTISVEDAPRVELHTVP